MRRSALANWVGMAILRIRRIAFGSRLQIRLLALALGSMAGVLAFLFIILGGRAEALRRQEVRAEMSRGAALFNHFLETQGKVLITRLSSLAQEPRLKAGLASDDEETLEALLHDIREETGMSFLFLFGARGGLKAAATADLADHAPMQLKADPLLDRARGGTAGAMPVLFNGQPAVCAALPVQSGGQSLGTLAGGEIIGPTLLGNFHALTEMEIVLAIDGHPAASSLTSAADVTRVLEGLRTRAPGADEWRVASLSGVVHALTVDAVAMAGTEKAEAVLIHSLAADKQFLRALHWSIAGAGLLGFLLVGVIASWIAGRLSRPILEASRRLQELARGGSDLTVKLPVLSRDEAGLLAVRFNEFLWVLHGLVMTIRREAEKVSSVSREGHQASKEVTQATGELVWLINDIATQAEASAQAVKKAYTVKEQAEEQLRVGQGEMDGLVAHMGKIRADIEGVSQGIESLGRSSERIGRIVTVIGRIAHQTKLLALNATIEAKHAGEKGEGFAVVAAEVRKLAEDSHKSVDEISRLIDEVLKSTSNAVQQTRRSREQADKSGAITVQVQERFRRMAGEIAGMADLLGRIAEVSDRAASSARGASTAGEELAATSRETLRNAAGLEGSAQTLHQLVEQFKTMETPSQEKTPPADPAVGK